MKTPKLVPMAGLEFNRYKGYMIEWIDYLNQYRVYEEEHPEQTCGYADCIPNARYAIDLIKEGRRRNE